MDRNKSFASSIKRQKLAPTCPCGKSNRDGKFAPFEDGNGGYCHSCQKTIKKEVRQSFVRIKPDSKTPRFIIPKKKVQKSLSHYDQNSLILWLNKLFGSRRINELLQVYLVGTSKDRKGATIFWTADENDIIKRGTIMLYDEHGHRVHGYNNSAHAILGKSKNKPAECFFGAHLIPEGKTCIIVESQKTALIGYLFYPKFTWLASNGASGINEFKMKPLHGRRVILLPDQDKYDQWKELSKKYTCSHDISVSNVAKERGRKLGLTKADIADILLNQKPTQLNHPKSPEEALRYFESINPSLTKLKVALDLVPHEFLIRQ